MWTSSNLSTYAFSCGIFNIFQNWPHRAGDINIHSAECIKTIKGTFSTSCLWNNKFLGNSVILHVTCIHLCQSMCVLLCMYVLSYSRTVCTESTLTDSFFQDPDFSARSYSRPSGEHAEAVQKLAAAFPILMKLTKRKSLLW